MYQPFSDHKTTENILYDPFVKNLQPISSWRWEEFSICHQIGKWEHLPYIYYRLNRYRTRLVLKVKYWSLRAMMI